VKNPKTTVLGILTIVAAVAKAIASLLSGGSIAAEDVALIVAGGGLIAAKDNK